jgi:hypothetical protein
MMTTKDAQRTLIEPPVKGSISEEEIDKAIDELAVPVAKEQPDFKALIEYLQYGLDTMAECGRPPKDFDHYVFETALEAVYGQNVWKWYNSFDY